MVAKLKINSEHSLKDLTGVAKTVSPLVKQLLGPQNFMLHDVLENWEQIIGKTLASYCLPQKIIFAKDSRTGGRLFILAAAGAFATELQQQSPQIINQINAFFGYPAITEIKISQAADLHNLFAAKKPLEKVKKNLVSAQEELYITELIKDVQNPQLQSILQKLGYSVLSEQKQKEKK